MGLTLTVVGDEEIVRRFGNSAARAQQMQGAVTDAARIIAGAASAETSSDTGALSRSWDAGSDFASAGGRVVALAGSPLSYAIPVETGRRPGAPMPPPDALEAWMGRHGIGVNPFVIARAIGRKGIEPNPILRRAIDRSEPAWRAVISETVAHLVERS